MHSGFFYVFLGMDKLISFLVLNPITYSGCNTFYLFIFFVLYNEHISIIEKKSEKTLLFVAVSLGPIREQVLKFFS